jgi:hypothetical protein
VGPLVLMMVHGLPANAALTDRGQSHHSRDPHGWVVAPETEGFCYKHQYSVVVDASRFHLACNVRQGTNGGRRLTCRHAAVTRLSTLH